MLIATLVAAFGFLIVAGVTQLRGYRLGGTITLGVLAVYTLKNFAMFPVFLLSTLLAYVGLDFLKRRTLIYGRSELLAAILVGTLIPVTLLATLSQFSGDVRNIAFVGSILPGLAAYNYHQMKPGHRRNDALATLVVFAGLVTVGAALVSPGIARAVGGLTPAVLFSETSEIAVLRGAVVPDSPESSLMPRQSLVFVLVVGMLAAEWLRSQFDVRTGVIAAALVAVFTVESRWLFVLYVVVAALSYLFITAVHRRTLRYGRVLLGAGSAFAVVVTLGFTVLLPISRGLAAFFVGVVAGVMAYNAHATAPKERQLVAPLQLAVFVPMLLLVRALAAPGPNGFPQALSVPVVTAGVVVTLGAFAFAYVQTVRQPDDDAVLSASVLSGGDGS
ncbi:poly-gamma-glutamate biosynthesis protein PgsC/CapC [Haloferax marisrubri]|uniref:Capsule biosynthesis CapC n=1 Tax=Haloferax marisrubri TaxID=1544719 RepID=A0A2P4NSV0_9EURY|nr:poly-gamma-glutamate biosynthesis protein PgsC/CapC [Haloferax marisrubri]POG56138.1 hypothetical protein AUR65_006375 [Haloferax marisrubri]